MQKRGKKFRVQYHDVFGNKQSATFSNKKSADEFLAKIRKERELVKHGLEVPRESVLVIDYVQDWLLKREESEKAHGTIAAEASRLTKHFVSQYGLRPLQSITSRQIYDLLDEVQRQEKWSNATRNRFRAALHKLFRDAFMREFIIANPVSRVPLLSEAKKSRPKKTPVTDEEFCKLLEAAVSDTKNAQQNRLFLTILLFEGPRISEICPLQHRDFDLQEGVIHFKRIWEQSSGQIQNRIKGKPEGKVIPLADIVKVEYLKYRATIGKVSPTSFIFPDDENGCLSTYQGKNRLRRWSELAGIRNINPHLLRATFATAAEEAGLSKEEIQRLMGHSTVLVTEGYTRMRIRHLIDRMKATGFGAVSDASNVVNMHEKNG